MYDVIALFKPTIAVKVSDVMVMAEAIAAQDSQITQEENTITLTNEDAQLTLEYRTDDEVVSESEEISKLFDVDCAECNARLEINGHDPEMLLINDYTLLIERLEKNPHVILFDPVEGALLET